MLKINMLYIIILYIHIIQNIEINKIFKSRIISCSILHVMYEIKRDLLGAAANALVNYEELKLWIFYDFFLHKK